MLVEIDLGSDQAGEDKLAGCPKVSDHRQRMNDRRDAYLFGRKARVDGRRSQLAALCGGDELTVLCQIGWCCVGVEAR